MNNMTELTTKINHRTKELRMGQAAFIYAYRKKPKLVDKIRGTDIDPFYNNENLSSFLLYLEENNY